MDKIIEWQSPVSDDVLNGTGYYIHANAKIHCFCNGAALCNNKMFMVPHYWKTTDLSEKDISTRLGYFCKKCIEKFKKELGGNYETNEN